MNSYFNRHPLELALRLLLSYGNEDEVDDDDDDKEFDATATDDDDDDDGDDDHDHDHDHDHEPATALIRRIEKNEITHLILRNVRLFDNHNHKLTPSPSPLSLPPTPSPLLSSTVLSHFRSFDDQSIRQATAALKINHSIRSISCRYDLEVPSHSLPGLPVDRRLIRRTSTSTRSAYSSSRNSNHSRMMIIAATGGRNVNHHNNHNNSIVVRSIHGIANNSNNNERRYRRLNRHGRGHSRHQRRYDANAHGVHDANDNNIVTIQQERRLIEACVRLPRLESLSLTGGNRSWKISHLIQILVTVKGLKRLTIRDIVIKSDDELYKLQCCLLQLKEQRGSGTSGGLLLEELDFTIEDQIDASVLSSVSSSSVFDKLIGILMICPNLKVLKITKSIFSRLNLLSLRPGSATTMGDISTRTLLKLTKHQSSTISKLVLNGVSFQRHSIEVMCNELVRILVRTKQQQQQQNVKHNHNHKYYTITHLEFTGCAFNHTVEQSGWDAMFRLMKYDLNITIIASSLIYHRMPPSQSRTQSRARQQLRYGRYDIDDDEQYDDDDDDDEDEDEDEDYDGSSSSGTIQRPRHDFVFSLVRDTNGTQRHFHNRGMEIEYLLQQAGFFRLLQQQQQRHEEEGEDIEGGADDDGSSCTSSATTTTSNSMEWIDVMATVKENTIALFHILRQNPTLCCAIPSSSNIK